MQSLGERISPLLPSEVDIGSCLWYGIGLYVKTILAKVPRYAAAACVISVSILDGGTSPDEWYAPHVAGLFLPLWHALEGHLLAAQPRAHAADDKLADPPVGHCGPR